MENYVKGETREVEEPAPFSALHDNVVEMRVSAGSKIRNIMGYAIKRMKEPDVKQITWNGSGHAVNKTISCAEIMKRKIKGLHQITKIRFRRIEEFWEPKMEGLERLKVNRDIPAISILLSREPVNTSQPGYQAPGSQDAAWLDRPQDKKGTKHKPGGPPAGNTGQKRKRKLRKDKPDNQNVKNAEKKLDTRASSAAS
ncbi:ribonuclease P protein subunit p25-like protein [Haliotis rufescens]|uniref:ribonuclease P protein subunit p25-like protein n=1 Tax=Haliotis rufescens TaxID=6454 RepID=UPI00201E7A6D|nr:ribonuclease P protein subunit p25-like protein [Haliotis rufescens]XP_048243757.1 ribonuclease P protein subunit p25-like protein [Haliotis rufescens]